MLGRRDLLTGLGIAAVGCKRKAAEDAAPLQPATLPMNALGARDGGVSGAPAAGGSPPDAGAASLRGRVAMDTWSFDGGGRAAVLAPAWAEGKRLPMLVALHGRGEAMKGPEKGVLGWPRDYALVRAFERLCAPPITNQDLEGFADPERLADTNRKLRDRPFEGVVVVCPYSPDVDLRKPAEIRAYATYVMTVVLPRARRELPVIGSAPATGIDGVSLGGALALRIGLGHPTAFGAVGTLQPAIGEDQVGDFTALVKAARTQNPNLALRLLTSKEDYFRTAITKTSEALRAAGIAHDYADVPGPHDYPFNRGPGAIEMLLWHDRTLARA
jgi:hypothetical protein